MQLAHRNKFSAKEYESIYKALEEQNKIQNQYLFDLQEQLLDIVSDIAKKNVI